MSNLKTKIIKNQIPYLKRKDVFSYGTSGYRTVPELLPFGRCALVAFMRSSTLAGKYIGIIITASHNPAQDNGIKLIDHSGEMFDRLWENITDKIVNCSDKDLFAELNKIHRNYGNYRPFGDGSRANIIIGRDTRESGIAITNKIKEVLKHLNCKIIDYEMVSTPQLHWIVKVCNQRKEAVTKDEYFDPLVDFVEQSGLSSSIRVDTSNGVSQIVLDRFNQLLDEKKLTFWFDQDRKIEHLVEDVDYQDKLSGQSGNQNDSKRIKSSFFIMTNKKGPINEKCGAQYVKYNFRIPPHLTDETGEFIAFDGDADRIIYFYINENKKLTILDGDRQASILVQFFTKLTKSIGIDVKIGCVLSDYSNSAAIKYCKSVCETSRARTGIKNLLKTARNYDIGVYNEPNGHGGVFFSVHLVETVEKLLSKRDIVDDVYNNIQILDKIIKMFIDGHADPLCNLLCLEYVKKTHLNLFIPTYKELPCRNLTISVEDQSILVLDNNQNVVAPTSLRKIIDQIVETKKARVFVRSSGTEKIIRVFCEAEQEVDILCLMVAQTVYDTCEGIGPQPEISSLE